MIFSLKNSGVEVTVEELYTIIENDRFDEFFDFLADLEEEVTYMNDDVFSPNDTIELTPEQQDMLLSQLTQNGTYADTDGDANFTDMTEEDILDYLFGGTVDNETGLKSNESEEWTAEDEKLKRFIRRLK